MSATKKAEKLPVEEIKEIKVVGFTPDHKKVIKDHLAKFECPICKSAKLKPTGSVVFRKYPLTLKIAKRGETDPLVLVECSDCGFNTAFNIPGVVEFYNPLNSIVRA